MKHQTINALVHFICLFFCTIAFVLLSIKWAQASVPNLEAVYDKALMQYQQQGHQQGLKDVYQLGKNHRNPPTQQKELSQKPSVYTGDYLAETNNNQQIIDDPRTTHIVKKGDTVFEISRQTGAYWKDIIKLNQLTPPYSLNIGDKIRIPQPTPPITVKEITQFDAPDFKPIVDKHWSYTNKLNTITHKQRVAFKRIIDIPNYADQDFMRKLAYIESVYNRYGHGKPHQKAPRGMSQFNKATAKENGLYQRKKGKWIEYRGNVAMNITSTLNLRDKYNKKLHYMGAPQTDHWRYLCHQQGVNGCPTLWKVYSGQQPTLTYQHKDKTQSTRAALKRNLTSIDLQQHPKINTLTDRELAHYFVQHWRYVFTKAHEASAYMLTQI